MGALPRPEDKTLNSRERFLATMNFQPADRALLWEMGYWGATLRRWYDEGLPKVHGIPDDRVVDEGDLVTIDVGVTLDGVIADSA